MALALVTGAGAGIGRACALALAAAGFEVVASDLDAAAARATADAGGGRAIACDVADDPAVAALFAELGEVEVLVHSAGLFPRRAFADSPVGELDRVMAVNFRAAFVLAKAALPGLTRLGGGSLVFLTSGAGLLGAVADPMQAGFSLYGASKAALDRWALGIAGELAPAGVAINTLTPGAFVHTPGLDALALDEARDGEAISPEAVAEAVVALARARPPETGRRLRATEFGKTWR